MTGCSSGAFSEDFVLLTNRIRNDRLCQKGECENRMLEVIQNHTLSWGFNLMIEQYTSLLFFCRLVCRV